MGKENVDPETVAKFIVAHARPVFMAIRMYFAYILWAIVRG